MSNRFAPGDVIEVHLSDSPWKRATVLDVYPEQFRSWGPESGRWHLRYDVQMIGTESIFIRRTEDEVRPNTFNK